MSNKDKKSGDGKDNITRWIVIGMVGIVLIAGIGSALYSSHASKVVHYPSSVSSANGYGITLNPTAKVKVDFWEDYQCPNCRNFESVAGRFINGLITSKKIQAVFHPMSFIGPESVLAANAVACAADSGKFLNMHNALYVNQPASENSGKWNNDLLILTGISAGVTDKKFSACVKNGKYQNWTSQIMKDADKQSVNSTPTMFINGKLLNSGHYLDLVALKQDFAAVGVK